MKRLHHSLIIFLGIGLVLFAWDNCFAVTVESVVGIYRCYEYNVNGSGSDCRNFTTQFALKSDGTYTFGGSSGAYKIQGNNIIFSEEKLRGPANFFDGYKFRFMYISPSSGWKVVQTYHRSGPVRETPKTGSSPKKP